MNWKQLTREATELHNQVGAMVIDLKEQRLASPLPLFRMGGETKRFAGRKVSAKALRTFMWEHRSKAGGGYVVWSAYDPEMDSSFVGLGTLE